MSLQAATVSGGHAGDAPERPNISWICTDQQQWDTIASLGNAQIRTPNIDRLASEGVTLTHTYCQNPICTPSRASFLTGCRPSRIHRHRNGNAHFPRELTLRLVANRLARAGYDGALCGKFHLSSPFDRMEPRLDDGYRLYDWSHHPSPEPGWPVTEYAYQRWLKEGGLRGPWFACINIFAPPFDPAPEYLSKKAPETLPPPLYREGEEREQARFGKVGHHGGVGLRAVAAAG
ncbi:MAG: sulfatase-like hydrolase/transferase [Bryobacterales bacterium]|nr:sulfatase-like hydrolase/transferase [Bryobacterales bacterium]